MGAIYAFATMAGSTGKTTSAVTLGVQLARAGYRTRIIDLDSQANASMWLGYEDTHGKTVADILRQDATIADVELPGRVVNGETEDGEPLLGEIDNLTLIPARRATLDKVMIELAASTGGVLRLREALAQAEPVDVTLIDCPGTMSTLVVAGMLATTAAEDNPDPKSWGVIACTQPALKGTLGLPDLEDQIADLRRTYRVPLDLLAIVPCVVPSAGAGNVYIEQMADLRDAYTTKVTRGVRRAAIVDEAFAMSTPLPLAGYRAKSVVQDYDDVRQDLEGLGLFANLPARVG